MSTDYQISHQVAENGAKDALCTCPVEGEFQIHHPHCGDPGWDELLTDVDAFVMGSTQAEAQTLAARMRYSKPGRTIEEKR